MTLEEFLTRWHGREGGAERANYALFLTEFCQVLGLPGPAPADADTETRGYQFEAFVRKSEAGEPAGTGRIDLYKPRHFVLEAKQSRLNRKATPDLLAAAGLESAAATPAGPRYDALMRDARRQAEDYARALPAAEGWPPFLIVCDVGRAFDIYFDWSGMGKDYGPFPDRQTYRIDLLRLRDPDVQALFRAIWTDPKSIDPRLKAVAVTRDVSWRLAEVSKALEENQRNRLRTASSSERSLIIEETALFVMRLLFCMFAEDVGLLPAKSFQTFLASCLPPADAAADVPADTKRFRLGLQELWGIMARAGGERFCLAINAEVRYFNGGLFENPQGYDLARNQISKLVDAAAKEWNRVEPSIFGTLLEQALTPEERAKLGAHYTPRPYVERLVEATIMEPLRAEWAAILSPSSSPLPQAGGAPSSPLPLAGGAGGGAFVAAATALGDGRAHPRPSREREGRRKKAPGLPRAPPRSTPSSHRCASSIRPAAPAISCMSRWNCCCGWRGRC